MKVTALLAGAVLGTAFAVAAAFYFLLPDPCSNKLVSEIASPDKSLKALVFVRDCGATTGFSTQVAVVKRTDALSSSTRAVFTSDTNHGVALNGADAGPEVVVYWESDRQLVLRHAAGLRVFRSESSAGAVAIRYQKTP